jgi:hypothetical protein
MPNTLAQTWQSLLAAPLVSRTRRNHGLEHATLHVLAERYPQKPMAGHSNPDGFLIIGDLTTEAIAEAIAAALQRMQGGERQLAVHPNCGTNFVVAGVLAGAAGALTMLGTRRVRDQISRLPMAFSLATLALIIAQPLGLLLQAHLTTSGEPGGLQVQAIRRVQRGSMTAHYVTTRG